MNEKCGVGKKQIHDMSLSRITGAALHRTSGVADGVELAGTQAE